MPDWKLWHGMAQESLIAAREIQTISPRSSVSRFYYAAYQSATSWLLYCNQQPPLQREAWSHAETPSLFRQHLGTAIASEDTKKDLEKRLRRLYKIRCDADYVSITNIIQADVDNARKDAGYILKVVQGILPEKST